MDFVPQGMTRDGVLAEGSVTAADLIGDLAGQQLAVLTDHMAKGWAYVNVHVHPSFGSQGVFCCPGGLRGAIRAE